ncbi:MAG: low temperature requirement protein A [Ornithinibacter sp.]
MSYTWFATAYSHDDPVTRLLTFAQMAGVLAVAAAVPAGFSGDLVIAFALWWGYFVSLSADALVRNRRAAFSWGHGHYVLFAAVGGRAPSTARPAWPSSAACVAFLTGIAVGRSHSV